MLAAFGQIMKHLKEGTPYQALYALNKLAVIADQVGEKELWHALSALSDVAMNKKTDSSVKVGAIEMLELIYPRAIMRKMERLDRGKSIEESFGEDENAAQTGLPAREVDLDSLLATFIAETGGNNGEFNSSEAEAKMASAILSIVFAEDPPEKEVDEAAFRAFNNIDSPILTDMITKEANPYRFGNVCFNFDGPEASQSGLRMDALDEPRDEPIPLVNVRKPQLQETLADVDPRMII